MQAPTVKEMLFSAKAFAASMLALWIAYRMALPRPFWAMMAAYVVANPLAGPVRSKAVYRLGGSAVGCVAVMFMVPALANAPELLTLAIALWVGGCLYVSLLDRTPRSYLFMLSGYTAALIALPSVADPSSIYDTGLARVSEIGLGIVCASLVHAIVLPQGIGPVLLTRLDAARRDSVRWIGEVLAGRHDLRSERDRRQLAAALTDLRLLATHLPFDTSHLRYRAATLQRLHDRMGEMLPLLYAVEDRLLELQRVAGAMPQRWLALLAAIAAQARDDAPSGPAAGALRAELSALQPALQPATGWRELLLLNLGSRLSMMLDRLEESRRLRHALQHDVHEAADAPAGAAAPRSEPPAALHRDHGMALLSGAAAAIGIVLTSWFWIATGWPYGASVPIMTAVFCSFFASMDNPVPAIKGFMTYTILSIPLSAFFLLVVLPSTREFGLLVLMMAPVFLVLGVYMARPATGMIALAMVFNIAPALGLQDTDSADFLSFVNGTLAQVIGVAMAALMTGLMRSVSTDFSARRILRAGWKDIARIGAPGGAPTGHLPALMLDRAGLLLPRLAGSGERGDGAAMDALLDLRVGMNTGELQRLEPLLAPQGVALRPLIAGVAQHYAGRAAGEAAAPAPSLLQGLDRAIAQTAALGAAAAALPDGTRAAAASALVGLRRDLFPRAQAYVPPPPPRPASIVPVEAA